MESQEHDDHIGLFPSVLSQERQSARAEKEQHSTTTKNESFGLQHTVHCSVVFHNITTVHVKFNLYLTERR